MRATFLSLTLVLVFACPLAAAAQAGSPASQHHTMRLVKLPNGDYTVPMNELTDPAWHGVVTLRPRGLRTLVTVTVKGSALRKHALELHPGSDCSAFGAANSIKLNPANTGVPSQTLVSLPITNLTSSDYVVAARDATNAQHYRESCAHL